jgi:gamma-glutamyltranspeptidase/glutathione hydrolase
MRRLALVMMIALACRQSEPQPREHVGSGSAHVVVADAGVAAPAAPHYRTAASDYHVDPKLAGTGKTAMVASEDPHATKAGEAVLAAGGNAVDAAIATAFVLAVSHPSAGNLAGGGFAVVRVAKGQTAALDFRETAPAAATANMFLDAGGNPTRESLNGDKACGVPGSVAGLWALHQKYGKTKWADLVAPAIALANDGFAVDDVLAQSLVRVAKIRGPTVKGAPLWWPNGKPRAAGETVKNPELAAVLAAIAQKGPDGFYKGDVAAAIVAEMKRGGGLITAEDLAGYKAVWREPIRVAYRGHSLITMPPPSSGGIVIAMTANMLKGTDLGKLPWHGTQHVHWLVEVWRRAYAARNEILGDPAYVKTMPLAKLTSQAYADELVKSITDKATPSKTIPGLLEGTHTTNLSVVDKTGMAVALTTTLNTSFGNAIQVDGFLLNNEMDDFTAKPGSPNVYGLVQGVANKIEPGKRMLSSMSPTIVEDAKGDVEMVLGGQGGARIITEVWQTLSNVIDFGMPVDAAIAAPRVHHQHLPDEVALDDDAISKQTTDELTAMGYVLVWSKPEKIYGAVNALVRTATGWAGAADPRGGGAALGD